MLAGPGLQPRPTKPAVGAAGPAGAWRRTAGDETRGAAGRAWGRMAARPAGCWPYGLLLFRKKTTNYRNMAAGSARRRGARRDDGGREAPARALPSWPRRLRATSGKRRPSTEVKHKSGRLPRLLIAYCLTRGQLPAVVRPRALSQGALQQLAPSFTAGGSLVGSGREWTRAPQWDLRLVCVFRLCGAGWGRSN